ncbi:MAG: FAD-dependent monooxygenase, partial [Gammaproteobacteria bacterium]
MQTRQGGNRGDPERGEIAHPDRHGAAGARVLIAGGGLIGATTALALNRAGIACTLVDADELVPPSAGITAADHDARPIAVAEGTRRVFETLGVWAGMASAATPIHMVHVSDRGGFGVTRITAARAGVEALGWVTPAGAIARALEAALAEASCSVECIVPGVALDVNASAGQVALNVCVPGGVLRTLAGELLVLADGGRSSLRERLGVRLSTRDYDQQAVVATVSTERPHENVAYERFTSEGPLALLPLRGRPSDGRQCALVWSLADELAGQVRGLSDQQFLERLGAQFGGRLGHFVAVSGRAAFPLALEVGDDRSVVRSLVL